jgi:hypothetical protein
MQIMNLPVDQILTLEIPGVVLEFAIAYNPGTFKPLLVFIAYRSVANIQSIST